MSEDPKFPAEGWGWPILAKKAHYFLKDSPVSHCRKWLLMGDRTPHSLSETVAREDDCKACFREAAKRAKLLAEQKLSP